MRTGLMSRTTTRVCFLLGCWFSAHVDLHIAQITQSPSDIHIGTALVQLTCASIQCIGSAVLRHAQRDPLVA